MTSHDPAPLFRNAGNCDHPEPPEPDGGPDGYDADGTWSDWAADHPESRDIGERVCELTRIGSYCPACTDIARKDFELAADAYIAAEDCVHAVMLP